MISLNVHDIRDVETSKIKRLFKDSYTRTIRLKTGDEKDLVEICLFADKPNILTKGLVQDTRIAELFEACDVIQEYLEQRSDVDDGIPNEENKLLMILQDALEKTEVLL